MQIKLCKHSQQSRSGSRDSRFNLLGPVLVVRPYCHTDHYWQVYFDTNKVIRESFDAAKFPVPEQHLLLRNGDANAANA
jgi:small conductance mechanosensitive channel